MNLKKRGEKKKGKRESLNSHISEISQIYKTDCGQIIPRCDSNTANMYKRNSLTSKLHIQISAHAIALAANL